MSDAAAGFRTFLRLCLGQVVSLFGSNLTGFVLGVWVYQQTGSVTSYSLIWVANVLPQLLVLPVAGVLVDRWDRRRVMIASDAGAALGTVALLVLASGGRLEVWHIYVATATTQLFHAFQAPAFGASIPLLVPKARLVQANGLNETGSALAQLAAPAAAGALLGAIGLVGVLTLDLATFAFAVLTLLSIRLPQPVAAASEDRGSSLLQEAAYGWQRVREKPGLTALLVLMVFTNFTLGLVQVLLTPLVLSFATAAELGLVLSVTGAGMVAGGVLVSLWGGPRRRVATLFLSFAFQGLVLFAAVLRPSVALFAAVGFCFSMATPFLLSAIQALWQSKIEAAAQGRVFAIRRLAALCGPPLAFLAAGPLADRAFEPWLAEGGRLAASLGPWFGTGPGRGLALLFVLLGALLLITVAIAWTYRPLRELDDLPDALEDAPQAT
jgi:MFS transporter, DHA3 family, macrolide efflux protein